MSSNTRIFLVMGALALALDQFTKQLVVAHLAPRSVRPVIEGLFSLTHVTNPGAAFSMLATAPESLRAWLFPLLGLLALALVVVLLRDLAPGDRLSALLLGGISGGACGNLADRLFRGGEVVDFLRVHLWANTTWPDFNVADSFIVSCVVLLLIRNFFFSARTRADAQSED